MSNGQKPGDKKPVSASGPLFRKDDYLQPAHRPKEVATEAAPEVNQGAWRERAFAPRGVMGTDEILTFSRDAKLLTTERAAQTGSDGLVIMPDGTKYVSSVMNGGVSRIRPGQAAELIAQNIPNAASMCYDEGARQLVIPMNANNGLAFVPLK